MKSLRIAIYLSILIHFLRMTARKLSPAPKLAMPPEAPGDTQDSTPRVFCFTHYQYSPIVLLCVAKDHYGPKNDIKSDYGKGYIRFRTPEQIADIARKQHKSVLSLEEAARKFPDAYSYAFRTSGPYYPHRTQTNDAARQIRKLLGQPS